MKLLNLHFAENKFNHLLLVLILGFFEIPLRAMFGITFPVFSFLLFATLIILLRAIVDNRKFFAYLGVGLTLCLILDLLYSYGVLVRDVGNRVFMVSQILYIVLLCVLIVLLISKIASFRNVDSDTVKGGIAIYILIGILFALMYRFIVFVDPNAFSEPMISRAKVFYYSFTVLTSLGFGDITPVNVLVVNLTSLEAIIGQIFLAVFVARLVGLYLMQNNNIRED